MCLSENLLSENLLRKICCQKNLLDPSESTIQALLENIDPKTLSQYSGNWKYEKKRFTVLQDQRNLKRYTASCVRDEGDGERFVVHTRTHW